MLLSSMILAAQIAQVAPIRQPVVQSRVIAPTLSFPEPGLDDAASYQGYQTRLYKDAAGNTLQIYLDRREGRVVHILADAENASIGFSARTAAGAPAPLEWGESTASVARSGRERSMRYALIADAPSVSLGWFLLGSMRVERDFQYQGGHRRPFGGTPFVVPELAGLADAMAQLPTSERQRHLATVGAPSVAALRARLQPSVSTVRRGSQWSVRVVQPSLDGRDSMTLTVSGDARQVQGGQIGDSIVLRALGGRSVHFAVRLTTTGGVLTPLARREIFTDDFLTFLDSARTAGVADSAARTRARWMERQVRGVELLSSREKLMAGLPTYATYFGRDMLVTATMMRGIWREDMAAFAVASALRKLGPHGEVSHEEALGGQAVREAAAEYSALMHSALQARERGEMAAADSLLARALVVLRDRRRVRENYHMVDDELQLPVLLAQWLGNPTVAASRKRAFLRDTDGGTEPRIARVLRELALVARMTAPYAAAPSASTLISFAPRAEAGWASASWRDSGAGYAGGRFAMDVNAIWAPHALAAIRVILDALPSLGFPIDSLARALPGALGATPLGAWARDSSAMRTALETWMGAGQHFVVRRSPSEVRTDVAARLAAMPTVEGDYWHALVERTGADRDSLTFLALSLDANGEPIGVVNTDVGTRLFLGDPQHGIIGDSVVVRDTRLFVRPYPVGLFVARVGPVVANDAFATDSVWASFVRDAYHGPRVVWGREVNLFLLGVARQAALRGGGDTPVTRELRAASAQVRGAVEASGFRSELWSYDFIGGVPTAVRYGSGGDVQLWSTTDLAVQFALSRLRW
ncbi:MAG: hypothetical protein ABI910_01790 [Gemmatimonadota bacterium]